MAKEEWLFIGKLNNWEFVFLVGWTPNTFEFHTEFSKNEMEDDYLYNSEWEYLFTEYIKYSHDHNCSFEDWVEMVKDEHPNGACYDDSYIDEDWLQEGMRYACEKDEEDYEYSNWRSSGWFKDDDWIPESYKESNYEWFIPERLKVLQDLYDKKDELKEEWN